MLYQLRPSLRLTTSLAVALLSAYLVYSLGAMFEVRFDSHWRANLGLVIDTAYFGFSDLVSLPAAGPVAPPPDGSPRSMPPIYSPPPSCSAKCLRIFLVIAVSVIDSLLLPSHST